MRPPTASSRGPWRIVLTVTKVFLLLLLSSLTYGFGKYLLKTDQPVIGAMFQSFANLILLALLAKPFIALYRRHQNIKGNN